MGTFTEFYIGLLKFINYKLFSDLGLPYPVADVDMPFKGEYYDTSELREMQANARKLFERAQGDDSDDAVDAEFQDTPEMI